MTERGVSLQRRRSLYGLGRTTLAVLACFSAPYAMAATQPGSRAQDGAWVELPPPTRASHAAIYDPVRDRMLVFGGSDGAFRNDT